MKNLGNTRGTLLVGDSRFIQALKIRRFYYRALTLLRSMMKHFTAENIKILMTQSHNMFNLSQERQVFQKLLQLP